MTNGSCDTCALAWYDEESDLFECSAPIDEDELFRLLDAGRSCPYYRADEDDYSLVRHQN